MHNDCQLMKRHMSTQAIGIVIEGEKTKANIRMVYCEGVKKCASDGVCIQWGTDNGLTSARIMTVIQ